MGARYHLVTAGAALPCSLLGFGAATTELSLPDALTSGLMSTLAALTAQPLVVLPLLIRASDRQAALFWPTATLTASFLLFRLTAYTMTFTGRGPFAGNPAGIPDDLVPAFTLTVSPQERAASVVVRDSGMGISEEDQAQVFTRFFRTAGAADLAIQGTGLGRSIVQSIVTQHGPRGLDRDVIRPGCCRHQNV